eukprot:TRINITY_DN115377_c0_g1_i1.p2 TRINITY_DN115377_c0_g1~~TRINITY_DN115377_c0_g1_i1.p2  ORF type:complete len:112 (-),score=24.48 TRINITY_DN115377_c0_g1_i1:576-911(-)
MAADMVDLHIRALSGRTVSLALPSSCTVAQVKEKLALEDGSEPSRTTLCQETKGVLKPLFGEDQSLEACGIGGQTVLYARRRHHAALANEYATVTEVDEPPLLKELLEAKD